MDPRLSIRLTQEQADFLASQTVGFHKISDVVRALIDQAMTNASETLDSPGTLGARPQGGLPSTSNSTLISKTLNLSTGIPSKRDICCTRQTNDETAAPKVGKARAKGVVRVRTRPDYPQAFELFWLQYRAIENRASGQNKILAFAAWSAAVQHVDGERLQLALSAAVQEQKTIQRQGGFASPFPDAFRWLRDGRFWDYVPSDTQQTLEAPSRALQGPLPSDPF